MTLHQPDKTNWAWSLNVRLDTNSIGEVLLYAIDCGFKTTALSIGYISTLWPKVEVWF